MGWPLLVGALVVLAAGVGILFLIAGRPEGPNR